MDYPVEMKPYVREQMRYVTGVEVSQDFAVEHRNFNIDSHPELTPIIINNFNRLEYLRRVIDAMKSRGYENLYVIDNASTYQPLLDFYQSEGLRVFYLDQNVGYLALWRTKIQHNFIHNHYVYTDPDIEPVEECPHDIVAHFKLMLDRHRGARKVGFGLKIDDLPEHYALKHDVINHENQFHVRRLGPGAFDSPIDTTFALYRPNVVGGWWLPAVRTEEPYVARHLPWYADSADPSEEDLYYQATSTASTHWTQLEDGVAP